MTHIYFVAPLLFLIACRTAHLGPDTNEAARAAWEAQRESAPQKTPTFGAEDARAINAARRAEKGKAGASTAAAPGSISLPSGSAIGATGAWPGAQGSMSLEAK